MVTEQTETLITVVFDNGNITKKFMCPAVFGQFLPSARLSSRVK
jgi:hypothetical protein